MVKNFIFRERYGDRLGKKFFSSILMVKNFSRYGDRFKLIFRLVSNKLIITTPRGK